ncbi:MAG: TrbG/VirB9 family P-type conjugative transfer protein [Acidobacteriota bacterium]
MNLVSPFRHAVGVPVLVWAIGLLMCPITQAQDLSKGIKTHKLKTTEIRTITMQKGKSTLLTMPQGEPIAEFNVGDSEAFTVEEGSNIFTMTAMKAGAETTLNIVMPDNAVYTWLLKEGVAKGQTPDFRIIAVADDATDRQVSGKRQFITLAAHEAEMQPLRDEVGAMKQAVVEAGTQAQIRIAEARAAYPLTLRRYQSQPFDAAPFFVKNIVADDEFTWIQITMGGHGAETLPALYEVLDGKPSMLNVITLPGRVTTIKIPKVVREGYLEAGKAKWRFSLNQ